ncbi:MAG: hypothetical protein AAB627_02055 [Patescibacteria group bacterium]
MPFSSAVSEVPKYLPNFVANYTKRLAESGYDELFKTSFFRWLVSLSPWKKYSIETILYVITTVLDQRLPENSLFREYAKQVVLDAAPEISKRMVNGARDELAVLMGTARNPEEKEFLSVVLSLGDDDISGLIRWLSHTELERESILHQLSGLPEEQKLKFLRLSDENKEKLMEFFGPKEEAEQKSSEQSRRILGLIADDINKLSERLEKSRRKETEQ